MAKIIIELACQHGPENKDCQDVYRSCGADSTRPAQTQTNHKQKHNTDQSAHRFCEMHRARTLEGAIERHGLSRSASFQGRRTSFATSTSIDPHKHRRAVKHTPKHKQHSRARTRGDRRSASSITAPQRVTSRGIAEDVEPTSETQNKAQSHKGAPPARAARNAVSVATQAPSPPTWLRKDSPRTRHPQLPRHREHPPPKEQRAAIQAGPLGPDRTQRHDKAQQATAWSSTTR